MRVLRRSTASGVCDGVGSELLEHVQHYRRTQRWHRPECAQECAQTRSENHHPPANGNHETNKKRA
jgi:hypothetical protein